MPVKKRFYVLAFLFFIHESAFAQVIHIDGSTRGKTFEGVGAPGKQKVISLEGIWKFGLDPSSTGISSNGVQIMPALGEEITLPGSTDQAGKGYRTQGMTSLRLARLFEYQGAAWYEKEVYVPREWQGSNIELFLERAHWQTRVWVNEHFAGERESLSVPHRYLVSKWIRPGEKNRIRIRVDNSVIHDVGYTHALSAETQTNWNGIIGKIGLRAFDNVYIHDVQVYPDAKNKLARISLVIRNAGRKPTNGSLTLSARAGDAKIPSRTFDVAIADSVTIFTCDWPLGDSVRMWDEFHPVLYDAKIKLTCRSGDVTSEDTRALKFGVRTLATKGTQFRINGRPLFLRGTVNSAEFPITAYPPTRMEDWLRIFNVCRNYGLNAMRFHSWCPPAAAFEAADALGFYLQVENSDWRFNVGDDERTNQFLREEADRILKAYGNHPSFITFCEGNEMVGPSVKSFLSELVTHWKATDPRHLYTGSAAYPSVPENDFNILYGARPQRWKEGLRGRFNAKPLDTRYDYADYVTKHNVPMITHEIGQWCVYPNFDEIRKYSGVLRPYNYELFRELMRERNMLDQAADFTMASGKFQVIQKKEEVESYLRTPGFGGYHMLELNDFPGQGTAPVGVVDIFWDPKPYVTASEFRRFQSSRVPLLRTDKFTWKDGESFVASAEFANFGDQPIKRAAAEWMIRFPDGNIYAQGEFEVKDIPLGSPAKLGELSVPLNGIREATRLDVIISLKGLEVENQWSIWVYPEKLPGVSLNGIRIAHVWNKKTKEYLRKGGTVLLLADTARIASDADPVFSGISWNTVWSGMPPNLLGILCDPRHPALKFFPTEFHSNWQWWDIVRHSKPMVLDHFPVSLKPVVQMIPDWNNPRKLGLVIEAKVGKGKLLLSSVDFSGVGNRPVAAQLLYSLEAYAAGADFRPENEVSFEMVDRLFEKK